MLSPIATTLSVEDQIKLNRDEQRKIEYEISTLKDLLKEKKLEEYLLNTKTKGPVLLPTDNHMGKYQFLTQVLTINKLDITIYPIWLSIGCTHPKWSNDIMSINLLRSVTEDTDDMEVLIDGISKYLNMDYFEARKFIQKNELSIPVLYSTDYKLDSNLRINFDLSEPIEPYEHRNKNYHLKYTDDDNMMINTAEIKFILVVPFNYIESVDSRSSV